MKSLKALYRIPVRVIKSAFSSVGRIFFVFLLFLLGYQVVLMLAKWAV